MRVLIQQAFGLPVPPLRTGGRATTPRIPLGDLIAPSGGMPETADMDEETFLAHVRALPTPVIVKTHGMPPRTDEPAIVLVRDGRAAIASYQRYRRDFTAQDVPIEQMVIGAPPLSHWGRWQDRWARHRGPTLQIRFEALTADTDGAVGAVATFLERDPVRRFDLGFADLKAVNPQFFSVGSNAPGIALIEERCPNLFWASHGDTMRRLGYGGSDDRPFNRRLVNDALAEVSRAIGEVVPNRAD